jgi:hypothetical protein
MSTAQSTPGNLALNKSQLAKLLATENLTVIHNASARTASFDTEKRVLTLPVWMNMTEEVYDLLVGHEVGHALYTDSQELIDGLKYLHGKLYPKDNFDASRSAHVVQQVVNVVEDPRIEKLTKRRYPGIRRSFNLGYKTLFEQGFFKIDPRRLPLLSLTDRINLFFKVGTHVSVPFNSEERQLVAQVEACETFADVLAASEAIILYVRENQSQQPPQPGDDGEVGAGGNDDGDSSPDTNDMSEDGDDDDSGDSGNPGKEQSSDEPSTEDGADVSTRTEDGDGEENASDSDGDGEESDDDGDDEESDGENATRGTGADSPDKPEADQAEYSELDALRSLTESALAESTKELAENNIFMATFTAPDIPLDFHVCDYKQVLEENRQYFAQYPLGYHGRYDSVNTERQVTEYKTSERVNISFMLKEFELRRAARTHARTALAKSGRLDTNKLHAYKTSDDLFRRNTIVNRGQSHGMFFLVDFSGSMSGCIKDLMKSLTSMTMFCRLANIPFEVYTFTDAYMPVDAGFDWVSERKQRRQALHDKKPNAAPTDAKFSEHFFLRNILSSRMNLKEYNEACVLAAVLGKQASGVDRMGGTPLLQSLMACVPMIEKFKKNSGLDCISFVTMTDGMSDSTSGSELTPLQNEVQIKPGYVTYLDKVSKKSYTTYSKRANSSWEMTATLCGLVIKSIQDRFNANTIGYFIGDKRNIGSTLDQLGVTTGMKSQDDYDRRQKMIDQYRDDGFITIPALGYDEFFLISPATFAMKTTSGMQQQTAPDVSVRKVFSEFKKQLGRRDDARALLKSFVARITAKDAA